MFDINSMALEPGTKIVRYDWDLEGAGGNVFPSEQLWPLNQPPPATIPPEMSEPTQVYSYAANLLPRVVTARLRVTDSNGVQSTATFHVTVYNPASCP